MMEHIISNLATFLQKTNTFAKGRICKYQEIFLQSVYAAVSGSGLRQKFSDNALAAMFGISRKTAAKRLKAGDERQTLINQGDPNGYVIDILGKGNPKFTSEFIEKVIEHIQEHPHVRVSPLKNDVLKKTKYSYQN